MPADSFQQMVESKNRETAGSRRQVFGRKANDQQHHQNLLNNVQVYLDELAKDPAGRSTMAALREMKSAVVLSRRRLE